MSLSLQIAAMGFVKDCDEDCNWDGHGDSDDYFHYLGDDDGKVYEHGVAAAGAVGGSSGGVRVAFRLKDLGNLFVPTARPFHGH